MPIPAHRRRWIACVGMALLCVAVSWVGLGCSNALSESEVLSKLQAAGLTIEKLGESLLTKQQRQRIEAQPETVFSVRVSDAEGHSQTMTFVGFERDWQAEHAKDEGVPGFVVHNWFFVGPVLVPQIQSRIEDALL